jgi:hypothetical protein
MTRIFRILISGFYWYLALNFSSGPLTNFKGAFHKIPCGHSPLKVMIMSQKWLPSMLRTASSQNSPTRNGALRKCYNLHCGLSLAKHIVGKQQWLVELGRGGQGCQDTPSAVTHFDSTPRALIAFLQCPPRSHRQRPAQPRPSHSPATAKPAEIFEACYWCIQ